MPVTDIFIRSYFKDFEWLEYCLKSIDIFCSGYRNIIVVVPEQSLARIKKCKSPFSNCQIKICENFEDDYMGQQVTKLYADSFSDADFICHVDSDCIFRNPFDIKEWISKNKIAINYAPYSKMNRPKNYHWKVCTDTFLDLDTANEFMLRDPYIYPRWVYPEFRNYCNSKYKVDLYEFIIKCRPRAFSEYNTMGAFLYHYFYNDFIWNDLTLEKNTSPCKNFWSYGGITPSIKSEILGYFSTKSNLQR
ncbi:MAG: DUF6492 family protein [Bacteroidota bacterium]